MNDKRVHLQNSVDAMLVLTDTMHDLIDESDFSNNRKAKLQTDLATIRYRTSALKEDISKEKEVTADGICN